MTSKYLTSATFYQTAESFLKARKPFVTPDTLSLYYTALLSFAEYLKSISGLGPRKVDTSVINGYFYHTLGTLRHSSTTATTRAAVLRIFYAWCIRNEIVSETPLAKMEPIPPPRERIDFYTYEEYQKLVAQAAKMTNLAHFMPAIITIAYHTGLRKRDIIYLRRSQINWTDETIELIPSKTKRRGVKVVIPIEQNELMPVLRVLYDRTEDRGTLNDYMLPDAVLFDVTISHYFAKICHAAKVRLLGLHAMRHSFCSRMINRGVDPITTASMSGHTDIRILSRYSHVNLNSKRAAILKAALP